MPYYVAPTFAPGHASLVPLPTTKCLDQTCGSSSVKADRPTKEPKNLISVSQLETKVGIKPTVPRKSKKYESQCFSFPLCSEPSQLVLPSCQKYKHLLGSSCFLCISCAILKFNLNNQMLFHVSCGCQDAASTWVLI